MASYRWALTFPQDSYFTPCVATWYNGSLSIVPDQTTDWGVTLVMVRVDNVDGARHFMNRMGVPWQDIWAHEKKAE
jgi:hypothetical protein